MRYRIDMQILDTPLRDVKLIRPKRFGDERGWFAEFFNAEAFRSNGLPDTFVQDNKSFSARGVLRGLHYKLGKPHAVRVANSCSGIKTIEKYLKANKAVLV